MKTRYPQIILLKIYCIFFILIWIILNSLKINAQQLLWHNIYDTGKQDLSSDVTTDSKGSIIVVGTTIPEETQPENHDDFLIVKYTASGDTLWTRRYNLTVADNAYGVTNDNFDNIIVAGSSWTESTNGDIHVVKYDSFGNIRWTRTYNNGTKNGGEFGYGITVDSKSNIIVSGKADYNFGDYITLKYDVNGNLLWVRTYDGGWEDYAQDVVVDDFDNIIVTGYSNNNNNWDWLTIKYSPGGNIIWVRKYDVAETDWAFGLATDKQANVIVVGETHYFYQGSGGSTAMVVKYTSQGDTLWSKIFMDTNQYSELEKFVDVAMDNEGNLYLAGDYAEWDTTGKVWFDYYLVKCNSIGDTIWTFRYNYDNEDNVSGIVLDGSGNIFVTGTTNRSPEVYEQNYLTIKVKNIVSSIADETLLPHNFILNHNYPNPFNPITIINYQLPIRGFVNLKIFDLLGREIETLLSEEKLAGIYEVTWNAEKFTSGIYIARLTLGDYATSQKLLLIK